VILITGASGFVGQALFARLVKQQPVRISVRAPLLEETSPETEVVRAQLSPDQDWSDALFGVSVVVHCAARVHVMNEESPDPLAEFRRVNVDGTLHLAREAAAVGVKRFVFLSSIKVNGEETALDQPFTEEDIPAPKDPYGISKYEAEEQLQQLARDTGMEVVIIRPPLVYGPGVKGNFKNLIHWMAKGIPLPLGAINNKRSFVALDNLIDLIITCLDHPAAANQVFLAGDGEDLSTTILLGKVASVLGKPARLFPVPEFFLRETARILGKQAIINRLCDSLQVDISKARRVLGWTPPVTVDEGLRRAVFGKS
jgi:nucleoside-diphosphate-sugar epimerase